MTQVVIAGGARTPVGSFNGALGGVAAHDLGAVAIKEALAREIPAATVIRPPSGHIGMMVGSQAPAGLWQPLAEWLGANAGR